MGFDLLHRHHEDAEQQQKRRKHNKHKQRKQNIHRQQQENNDSGPFPRTNPYSNIIEVKENVREGKITAIVPLTFGDRTNKGAAKIYNPFILFADLSMYLAVEQFNSRSGEILPHLPERLRECNLYLTLESRNSHSYPLPAARAFLDAFCDSADDNNVTGSHLRFLQPEQDVGNVNSNSSATTQKPFGIAVPGKSHNTTQQQAENATLDVSSSSPSSTTASFSSPAAEPPEKFSEETTDTTASGESDTGNAAVKEVDNVTEEECRSPFSIIGESRSLVTDTLSTLGDNWEVPIISPASTATQLEKHPFFARTIPTNLGDSKAIALYLQQVGASHVGIIYVRDQFGISFHGDLVDQLSSRKIKAVSASFSDLTDGGNEEEIDAAINVLVQSEYRYIVAILISTHGWILEKAVAAGIMGHAEYHWILTEAMSPMLSLGYNRATQQSLAQALHGTAFIVIDVPQHEGFNRAITEFASNVTRHEKYFQGHKVRYVGNIPPKPLITFFQTFSFDAAIALGIAACETPGLFTGRELLETILNNKFEGVSGYVDFDNITGSRVPDNIPYKVLNMYLSDNLSTDTEFQFAVNKVAQIKISTNEIISVEPFRHYDNSTTPPPPLPAVVEDLHLVSLTARVIGLTLCGCMIALSIGCAIWTFFYPNNFVVRASQPIFLCLLCIGTLIFASAIIPLSFQEPMSVDNLDTACQSVPWLLSIGFVTAFSALFSKTWRLNKLFKSGVGFRRIQVNASDVMLPFFILTVTNFFSLLLWTFFMPMKWIREPLPDFDRFGRSIASYGICRPEGDNNMFGNPWIFLVVAPLFIVNIVALLVATYQGYIARNLPTDFSEAKYLAMSKFSLLETGIMAGPLIFMLIDSPTANFLIQSFLISAFCAAILLPMFVPKYLQQTRHEQRSARSSTSAGKAAIRAMATGSRRTQQPGDRKSNGPEVNGGDASSNVSRNELSANSIQFRGMEANDTEVREKEIKKGMSRIHRTDAYYEQIENSGAFFDR